jgi:hypothetical protein
MNAAARPRGQRLYIAHSGSLSNDDIGRLDDGRDLVACLEAEIFRSGVRDRRSNVNAIACVHPDRGGRGAFDDGFDRARNGVASAKFHEGLPLDENRFTVHWKFQMLLFRSMIVVTFPPVAASPNDEVILRHLVENMVME